jgi:hypothetical protein
MDRDPEYTMAIALAAWCLASVLFINSPITPRRNALVLWN